MEKNAAAPTITNTQRLAEYEGNLPFTKQFRRGACQARRNLGVEVPVSHSVRLANKSWQMHSNRTPQYSNCMNCIVSASTQQSTTLRVGRSLNQTTSSSENTIAKLHFCCQVAAFGRFITIPRTTFLRHVVF